MSQSRFFFYNKVKYCIFHIIFLTSYRKIKLFPSNSWCDCGYTDIGFLTWEAVNRQLIPQIRAVILKDAVLSFPTEQLENVITSNSSYWVCLIQMKQGACNDVFSILLVICFNCYTYICVNIAPLSCRSVILTWWVATVKTVFSGLWAYAWAKKERFREKSCVFILHSRVLSIHTPLQ